MATTQANSPMFVHAAALALALISSVPMPNGPADALKSVAWISYGFVEDAVKGSSILSSLKQQSENYIGVAAFAAYFIFTTYMTLRIFLRLAQSASTVPDDQSQKISVFSSLAFLSFTVQVVNLGLFLTDTYIKWTRDPVIRLKLLASSPGAMAQAWQWLSTSSLFVHFAKSLYQTNGGYWWSAQGLLASMLSSTYISAVGQLYNIDHLADYILLAQLLPASFAQNLFFIAILLARFKKSASSKPASGNGPFPEAVGWAALAGFRALIAYLPVLLSKTEQPVAVIGGVRALLFFNYFVSFSSGSILEEALPWTLLYKIVFSLSPASMSVPSLLAQVYSIGANFVAITLGVDFTIWYFSVAVWALSEYLG